MELFIELIGWLGTILIVLSYLLVSSGKLKGTAPKFLYMNILGAIAIAIHVYFKQSWPAFSLQIVWIIISLSALRKKKQSAD